MAQECLRWRYMYFHAGSLPEVDGMAHLRASDYSALAVAVVFLAVHAALVPRLYSHSRPPVAAEMEVVLPRFAQVLMAAGDRFLAADLAVFRALVASTETMGNSNYIVLAQVQQDAAWFNPAHEDNYYIAAAILPWYGHVDAAQAVLRKASQARPFDWQPAFYHGFNAFHFRKDALAGAEWLRIAAAQASDKMDQIQLQQMAANWVGRAEDRGLSIRLMRTMAKETQHRSFARFLEKRAQRLENIEELEGAVMSFKDRFGRLPNGLNELLESSLLDKLPEDPFGVGYVIDAAGKVVTVQSAVNGGADR